MSILENMVNALLNSQDRGIIFGDILKAYGAQALYSVSPISVDYTLEPVYDKEVLSQIENSTSFGNLYNSTSVPRTAAQGPIVQAAGRTGLQHQLFKANIQTASEIPSTVANGAPFALPLNFHQKEFPTPEQIMVATRLRSQGTRLLGFEGTTGAYYGPAFAGTEVIVWAGTAITRGVPSVYELDVTSHTLLTDSRANSILLTQAEVWAAFDWCPMLSYSISSSVPFANTAVDPKTVAPVYAECFGVVCDYDNYTILNALDLSKMHQTAIYGLFGVPTAV